MQYEDDFISLALIGSYEIYVVATDLGRRGRIKFFGLQHFKYQVVES